MKPAVSPFVFVPETSDDLLSLSERWAVSPVQQAMLPPVAEPAPAEEPAVTPSVAPAPEAVPMPPQRPAALSVVEPAAPVITPKVRKTARPRPRAPVARIAFDTPTLAPLAHSRFCQKYAADCRPPQKLIFRPGIVALTGERHRELARVNTEVNRAIRPTRVNETVAGEQWLIAPKSGDCNDYAVTKRHELLAKGWPARALLLAEVVTTWGEHHLVLVVRTRDGDLVADNMNANIRPWNKTSYQWVRMQSPANPKFWSTIKAPEPVVAMAAPDARDGEL